jgi:hypothetical protein
VVTDSRFIVIVIIIILQYHINSNIFVRWQRPPLNCSFCRTITTCCQCCHHKKTTESSSSSSSSSCQFGTSGSHDDDICAYSKLKPPPPTPIIITSVIQYPSLVVPSSTIPLTTQIDHRRHPQQEPTKENEGIFIDHHIHESKWWGSRGESIRTTTTAV